MLNLKDCKYEKGFFGGGGVGGGGVQFRFKVNVFKCILFIFCLICLFVCLFAYLLVLCSRIFLLYTYKKQKQNEFVYFKNTASVECYEAVTTTTD
jgi:hypothetical protein